MRVSALCVVLTVTLPVSVLAGEAPPQAKSTPVEAAGPVDAKEFGDFVDAFFEEEMAKSNIPGAVFLMVKDGYNPTDAGRKIAGFVDDLYRLATAKPASIPGVRSSESARSLSR